MRALAIPRWKLSKQFRWAFVIIGIGALLVAVRGDYLLGGPWYYVPLLALAHTAGPLAEIVFSPRDLLTLPDLAIAAAAVFLVGFFEFQPNRFSRSLAIVGYIVWFVVGAVFTYQYAFF